MCAHSLRRPIRRRRSTSSSSAPGSRDLCGAYELEQPRPSRHHARSRREPRRRPHAHAALRRRPVRRSRRDAHPHAARDHAPLRPRVRAAAAQVRPVESAGVLLPARRAPADRRRRPSSTASTRCAKTSAASRRTTCWTDSVGKALKSLTRRRAGRPDAPSRRTATRCAPSTSSRCSSSARPPACPTRRSSSWP